MLQRHLATPRAQALAAVLGGLLVVFVLRLGYVQLLQHDYYVSQADSESSNFVCVPSAVRYTPWMVLLPPNLS